MFIRSIATFSLPLLSLVAGQSTVPAQEQLRGLQRILQELSPQIANIAAQLGTVKSRGQETDNIVGQYTNQYTQLLNEANARINNLHNPDPPPAPSTTSRRATRTRNAAEEDATPIDAVKRESHEKRQNPTDIQYLEATLIRDVLQGLYGLTLQKVPTLTSLIPPIDQILAIHIKLVLSKLPNGDILKQLVTPLGPVAEAYQFTRTIAVFTNP